MRAHAEILALLFTLVLGGVICSLVAAIGAGIARLYRRLKSGSAWPKRPVVTFTPRRALIPVPARAPRPQALAVTPVRDAVIPAAVVAKVGSPVLEAAATAVVGLFKVLAFVVGGAIRLAVVLVAASAVIIGIGIAIALCIAFPPLGIVALVLFAMAADSRSGAGSYSGSTVLVAGMVGYLIGEHYSHHDQSGNWC
jgi:hypothetical protein